MCEELWGSYRDFVSGESLAEGLGTQLTSKVEASVMTVPGQRESAIYSIGLDTRRINYKEGILHPKFQMFPFESRPGRHWDCSRSLSESCYRLRDGT